MQDCREHYTDHTCDKRRTKSYIQERFPSYDIEEGFTEEDLRYTGDEKTGETPEGLVLRAHSVLDRIFQDNDTEADCMMFSPFFSPTSVLMHGVYSHLSHSAWRDHQRVSLEYHSDIVQFAYWRSVCLLGYPITSCEILMDDVGVIPLIVKASRVE